MRSLKPLLFFLLFFSGFFLAACNDGGGPGGEPGGSSGSGEVLNPGLSGVLFVPTNQLLDVATGTFTRIPNTNWKAQKERFPYFDVEFKSMAASYDRNEFVVTANSCRRAYDDALAPLYICMAIQGYDGTFRSFFELGPYSISDKVGAARLSRDRQYIALWLREGGTLNSWLQIYDRQGNRVSSRKMREKNYDWLPDGRLVYASGNVLRFTLPYSTEADPQRDVPLPAEVAAKGTMSQLAVSPDGTQVAFTLVSSYTRFVVTYGTPWIMNIDGTGLRQVATTPEEEPNINWPKWSPDGKWLLVEVGDWTGVGPGAPGRFGHFYVVPAEDHGKVFMLDRDGDRTSPEARPLYRYKKMGSREVTKAILRGVRWLP